mmetsp:Transcript_22078/g.57589  ORF Transcript_22078/g.57589 Transcript_22078/m.57589 type:complete len:201 (+) Transcript_22078:1441-2043(+)
MALNMLQGTWGGRPEDRAPVHIGSSSSSSPGCGLFLPGSQKVAATAAPQGTASPQGLFPMPSRTTLRPVSKAAAEPTYLALLHMRPHTLGVMPMALMALAAHPAAGRPPQKPLQSCTCMDAKGPLPSSTCTKRCRRNGRSGSSSPTLLIWSCTVQDDNVQLLHIGPRPQAHGLNRSRSNKRSSTSSAYIRCSVTLNTSEP